ncbi:MAG: TadE/TadG family type IV pilus assembly protein [Planctomycetaceae bacterium]
MKLLTKVRDREQRTGAVLVEAAVVLPILLILVLGIIEFGRGMMVVQLLTNGAREGARSAVLNGSSNATVDAHVKSFLPQTIGCDPADLTIAITITPDPANSTTGNEIADSEAGDLVNVEISVPYDRVGYITAGMLSGSVLRARNTMRRE